MAKGAHHHDFSVMWTCVICGMHDQCCHNDGPLSNKTGNKQRHTINYMLPNVHHRYHGWLLVHCVCLSEEDLVFRDSTTSFLGRQNTPLDEQWRVDDAEFYLWNSHWHWNILPSILIRSVSQYWSTDRGVKNSSIAYKLTYISPNTSLAAGLI